MLQCDNCGPLEFGLMDGYGFGDRLLEGVMFEVRMDEHDAVTVRIKADFESYFNTLNTKLWLERAQRSAEQEDVLDCPKCGAQIDGPDTVRWLRTPAGQRGRRAE